jgi:hypothetical protein
MHNVVGSAVVALETSVGTNSGTNVLKNFTAGKLAVFNTGGTLDAGVLGTPMIRGGTVGTAVIGTSSIVAGSVGTALIRGGTVGTALIGTSTIQGGTANALNLKGVIGPAYSTTLAGTGGTSTLDLSLANEFRCTFGTANGTLAVSNATDGQKFIISLTQDAVGTRTMVWFDTIKWVAAGTPALTTTAAKRDTFGFICTGAATFDGFVIGQNI